MNLLTDENFESYINPNDLAVEEINYELKLRCLSIEGSLQEKRQRLKKAQIDEIRKPIVLKGKKTIVQEYDTVRTNIRNIKHLLELFPEPQYISRLRHYRLRILRANTITREQQRLRGELLSEIENLLDRFGNPQDKRISQVSPRLQLNFSQDRISDFERRMEEEVALNLSGVPEVLRTNVIETQEANTGYDQRPPQPRNRNESQGLLEEAAGGIDWESLQTRDDCNDNQRDFLLPDRQTTNINQGLPVPLLPRRQIQSTRQSNISPHHAEGTDQWKNEMTRYIQETISTQMAAMMGQITSLISQQRTSTPPPPRPSPPTPPIFNFERMNYPNSVASHVSIGDEFRPSTWNRTAQDVRNKLQVPVNKWRIYFSGDSRGPTVTQFLNRVEILAKNNRVTEQELLSQANFFFKEGSEAEDWYYTFFHKFTSWTNFKHQLRLRFEQPNKDRIIERQIMDRRQLPQETFNAFVAAIEKLAQQLTKPLSEDRKLEILLENMRDNYKPFLTIYRIERIEELITICHGLDKSMYRSYSNFPRHRPQPINCLEGEVWNQEEVEEEINAINKTKFNRNISEEIHQSNTNNSRDLIELNKPFDNQANTLCWNCRQFGHFWRNCIKAKKIFCHFCGQMNYITSNCPKNHRFPPSRPENENTGSSPEGTFL